MKNKISILVLLSFCFVLAGCWSSPSSPSVQSPKSMSVLELTKLLNATVQETDSFIQIRLDTYSNVNGSSTFVYEFIEKFSKEFNFIVFSDSVVESPEYKNKMDLGFDFLEYEAFDTYDVLLIIGKEEVMKLVLINYDAARAIYSGKIYNIRYRRNYKNYQK